MNHPIGAHFDFHTMRMEITSFTQLIFNPVAQAKFFHTISAGYVTGSIFVLAISAYFLFRKRNVKFAKRLNYRRRLIWPCSGIIGGRVR